MLKTIDKLVLDAFVGDWVVFQEQMLTTNVGSEIRFLVDGSKNLIIDWPNCIKSSDSQQTIAIKIDNQEFKTVSLTEEEIEYPLPDDSLHKIRIVVQSNIEDANYWLGDQDFRLNKIYVNDGQLIVEKNNLENIYFIGDSITSGSKMQTENLFSENNHAESSYAIQVADHFNLNNIRVSYNGTGITNKAYIYPPTAFDFIWKLKNDLKRPNQRNAKAIVINIGTNDARATEQEFKWSLRVFLTEITKRFHQIPIYLMIPLNQQFADIFRLVVSDFDNIKLIETKDIKITFADQLHPDQNGHNRIAEYLIEYFEQEFN